MLSRISTWIMMVFALILAIALPFMCTNGFFEGRAFVASENIMFIMPLYYGFCVPMYVALFSLNRLLAAVKRDEVFTAKNVRYLRIISWACIAAGLVLLIGAFISIAFIVLAIIAVFFGIILRVMKNLFAAAVELQDENNYTI